MSDERPDWPVEPRPFLAYRQPRGYQPARAPGPREVWADTRRFFERVARPYRGMGRDIDLELRRWTAETTAATREWPGEWPAECTAADFEAAVRLAHERFGKATYEARGRRAALHGVESVHLWRVPVARADEVLEFLEGVPTCTGGDLAPVRASYWSLFELRDLVGGKPLPGQGPRHHPVRSTLRVELQRDSVVEFRLILPFAEPDEAAADYVVALQEFAPVWLDPRYFDHHTPSADGSRYWRHRLPPEWVGRTPDGALRLDPSRSGITPAEVDLPTPAEIASHDRRPADAAMQAHAAAVEAALRHHEQAALVIRAPAGSSRGWLTARATQEAGLPVHRLDAAAVSRADIRRSIAPALREILARCGEAPAVLVVEEGLPATPPVKKQMRRLATHRALRTVRLPAELRLVVLEYAEMGETTQAAARRYHAAEGEGFATREQLRHLRLLWMEAANAEITVTREPRPRDQGA